MNKDIFKILGIGLLVIIGTCAFSFLKQDSKASEKVESVALFEENTLTFEVFFQNLNTEPKYENISDSFISFTFPHTKQKMNEFGDELLLNTLKDGLQIVEKYCSLKAKGYNNTDTDMLMQAFSINLLADKASKSKPEQLKTIGEFYLASYDTGNYLCG